MFEILISKKLFQFLKATNTATATKTVMVVVAVIALPIKLTKVTVMKALLWLKLIRPRSLHP
jgi:hypothetical protein